MHWTRKTCELPDSFKLTGIWSLAANVAQNFAQPSPARRRGLVTPATGFRWNARRSVRRPTALRALFLIKRQRCDARYQAVTHKTHLICCQHGFSCDVTPALLVYNRSERALPGAAKRASRRTRARDECIIAEADTNPARGRKMLLDRPATTFPETNFGVRISAPSRLPRGEKSLIGLTWRRTNQARVSAQGNGISGS